MNQAQTFEWLRQRVEQLEQERDTLRRGFEAAMELIQLQCALAYKDMLTGDAFDESPYAQRLLKMKAALALIQQDNQ